MDLPLPEKSQNMISNPKVRASKNRLQIRFRYPKGINQAVCLPLTDNPLDWAKAEGIAAQIKSDILLNNFDQTHYRYKAIANPAKFIEDQTHTNFDVSLLNIWKQFFDWQKNTKKWSESSVKDYKRFTARIEKLPNNLDCLNHPIKVQNLLLYDYSPETTRRTMQQLNAACNWAAMEHRKLIPHNPFASIEKIKQTKGTKNITCKPFSKKDVKTIINAFLNDTYKNPKSGYTHSHYTDYVEFMFLTGSRPEEACEIRKKDIDKTHITIQRAYRVDIGVLKNTKTCEPRKFPMNVQIQAIVARQTLQLKSKNDLLFTGHKGSRFDYRNFCNRTWKKVITGLYLDNQIEQILPPYNCKHTFISHCLDQGISPTQISAWVGTSAKVITENYAGALNNVNPPILYS